MKKNYFNLRLRSQWLLIALLALLTGASPAWAEESITESFEYATDGTTAISISEDTKTLSNGWTVVGSGSTAGIATSGWAKALKLQTSGARSGNCIYAGSNSAVYIVCPAEISGTLSFYWKRNDGSGTVKIYAAEKDGETFTIGSLLATADKTTATNMSSYFNFSTDLGSDPVYVAFLLYYAYLDDVTYTPCEETGCKKPKSFTYTSTTYNSATLGWTAGGEETAWQLVYDTNSEFNKDAATPVDITTNPYILTGLSENTTYYAYLRAKIGENVSSWTSKINFTTPAQYPAPTEFTQTTFTATSATMSWTANGGESKWNIKYSTDESFDPASAGTLVAVTTNPYTLDGLTEGTTYYAYVQADYDNGHTSNWSNKVTLTPTSTLNLLVNDGTTTNGYVPLYGYYTDQGANSQFIIPATSLTGMTNRLITKLTVHALTSSASFTNEVFEVYLKNVDAETTTFADNTLDWTDMTKVYSGSLSVSSNTMVIEFSTPFVYTTGSLMVGFKETTTGSACPSVNWYGIGTSGNTARYLYGNYDSKGFAQFLPKMTITSDELPAVMTPTGLVKNSVAATTATLVWTENGDATAWQIKYSTTEAFDPDSEGTLVEANANPFTVTSLEAETTYYAYVRAKKGGDVSDWSNKVTFTTEEMYPKPTAVSVSPADVSATFKWTAGRDEAAWQIKYSTDENFDPASEGTLQGVTTKPYTLTGLTVGETYYAYIRADYGESHYSLWSDKLTFTTAVEHELTVNEGNGSTTSGSVPFSGYYTDNASKGSSQFIIPASQLGSMNGRNINKITFYTTENIAWKSGGNPTFKVYLKEVNNEKFGSKAFIDWATMTEIYDGEIAFDGKQLNISLATPFNYNGGNLMVGFYQTAAGGWCNTSWVGTGADNEVGVQNASGATSYNWAAFLPKTTFYYETLTGPRLAVSTDALDFGELNQSSTAEDKQKTFTISNTGVQELTGLSVAVSGTGYSVSALPRTNITTAGAESAPIELTVTLNPSESGSYPGTVTISAAGQPNKVINLTATYVGGPMFGVFNNELATEAATTGQTINFGYAQEAPTYTYYIKNTGVGTLDVAVNKGGLTVSPASASLAAGEQQAFTITADVANADATVTFTGTNHDGGAEVGTFNVTLQGTVMPLTATFFESFNYANGNATTTELAGWEINNNTYNVKFNGGKLCYDASSTEAGNVITPKLRVSGTSDVLRINASITNKSWSNTKVAISYSADKVNWTELTNKGKNDFTTAGVLQAFELNGIPEGSYYFKIELSDAAVDYFYGFSTTLPDAETIAENVAPAFTTGVKDINLKHSFVAGWNTVCLPFTINATDIHANAKALEFSAYNDVTKELTFAPVTELTASKPYVIYVPDAISIDDAFTFYNASIASTTASDVTFGDVTFHGTYAQMAAGSLDGKWGLTAAGKIAKAGASTTMKGFRGYFSGVPAGARVVFFGEDELTGIRTISVDNSVEGVYNLKGQKVEKMLKGNLYIINGKKTVVR